MFFPNKIRNISPSDRVLEIGPGAQPHPRADLYLDKVFSDEEAFIQAGYSQMHVLPKNKIIYYENYPLPFEDKEFDYVICSHVIEHIPLNELDIFISEIQRIAKKGYIEFPTVFYELINYESVHIWLMNYRNETLYFLDKNVFKSNFLHLTYRELFYCKNSFMYEAFSLYRELFFIGFEWSNKINYKIVTTFNELINEIDYLTMKEYIGKNSPKGEILHKSKLSSMKNILKKYLPPIVIKKIKKFRNRRKSFINISSTAIIQKTDLIKISESAEIKDYVIIRVAYDKIVIGNNTQINPFTVLYGGSGIIIGNDVMIGPNCVLSAGNHDYVQTQVSMRFADNISKGPIIIEDDVWIGANCTITDGVTIKKGAVVGANSLICKDVEQYSIVGGVPAKKIGKRR